VVNLAVLIACAGVFMKGILGLGYALLAAIVSFVIFNCTIWMFLKRPSASAESDQPTDFVTFLGSLVSLGMGVCLLVVGAVLPLGSPPTSRSDVRETVYSVVGLLLCVVPALLSRKSKTPP